MFDANTRAAAEAVLLCLGESGSLVRVTFTDSGQVYDTLRVLINLLAMYGVLGPQKKGDHPLIELTNGSAVEFRLELEQKRPPVR